MAGRSEFRDPQGQARWSSSSRCPGWDLLIIEGDPIRGIILPGRRPERWCSS